MPQTPVRASQARRTETPNAQMTTLASPSQGAGPTAPVPDRKAECEAVAAWRNEGDPN